MGKTRKSKSNAQSEEPITVIIITCHYCAYDPPGSQLPKDSRCPKCLCFSWEKLKMPQRVSVFSRALSH